MTTSPKKLRPIALATIVFLILVIVAAYFYTKSSDNNGLFGFGTSDSEEKSDQDSVADSEATAESTPTNTPKEGYKLIPTDQTQLTTSLLFTFDVKNENFKLAKTKRYPDSYIQTPANTTKQDYTFQLIKDDYVRFETNFNISTIIKENFSADRTEEIKSTTQAKTHSIQTPNVDDNFTIKIYDSQGKLLLEETVKTVK